MKYERTILLKNGVPCILRNADAADAQEVCTVFELTHAQTDNLLSYPEECTMQPDTEAEYLAAKTASSNEIELCAVVDGKIVGTASIDALGDKIKLCHRAEFGIGIDKAYWRLGIGHALTAACIECAKAAGYAQLELDVVADNAAALSLYRRAGFTEYGRNPRGFRTREGTWQELVLMRLELD